MATQLDQYREILSLVAMQISFAEKKLATKKRQQAELFNKAAQLLAALPRELPKAQDLAALAAAEKWQIQTRLKAGDYREDATGLLPVIADLQQDLRVHMQKRITIEALINKAALIARRAEEQSASDALLALDTLQRRFRVNKW